MTARTILDEIKPLGTEGYRKVLRNHGVTGPCFGVKIADLKPIQKRLRKDYRLALELYKTGIYDAMYLAGLIADDARMTRQDLQGWVDEACGPLAGSTVPWVAAGSPHGWELAREWIDSDKELVAVAGWATLGCLTSIKEDAQLDVAELKRLLQCVQRTIHEAPDPVRYQMNAFVICVGCYVAALTDFAKELAAKISPVEVGRGQTACQIPSAADYIRKVEKRGTIGKKRKTAKC